MSFSDLTDILPALRQQGVDTDALSSSHLIGALLAKLDIADGLVDPDFRRSLTRSDELKASFKLAFGGPLREDRLVQAYRSVMYYHQRTIRLRALDDRALGALLESYLCEHRTTGMGTSMAWFDSALERVPSTATKHELLLQLVGEIPASFATDWLDNRF